MTERRETREQNQPVVDRIENYSFDLPGDLIAQQPLPSRDQSRLLVLDRAQGTNVQHRFCDLSRFLNPGDLLVLNETKVLAARLRARRSTGGKVELLLIRPTQGDRWLSLARPAAKIRSGAKLGIVDDRGEVVAEAIVVEEAGEGERVLEFLGVEVPSLLERWGHVPLPPYIRRDDQPEDRESYQTVFARVPGAVAAPTAGLHFTQEILAGLESKSIRSTRLVLHVGPGTFRPIQEQDFTKHKVEAEWCHLSEETAAAIRETKKAGGRVVAVGTTSTRALEAVARQHGGEVREYQGWVDLFIHPPFEFQVVDALITNFHLPRSSLLLLVCAFAGRERILRAYQEAVEERYRFYSYGDAMLIL